MAWGLKSEELAGRLSLPLLTVGLTAGTFNVFELQLPCLKRGMRMPTAQSSGTHRWWNSCVTYKIKILFHQLPKGPHNQSMTSASLLALCQLPSLLLSSKGKIIPWKDGLFPHHLLSPLMPLKLILMFNLVLENDFLFHHWIGKIPKHKI